MQRLEVSGAVRPIYGSLGFKGLITTGYDSFAMLPADCERCTLCLFSFHVFSSSSSFNFHDSDHGQSYEVIVQHAKYYSRTLLIARK